MERHHTTEPFVLTKQLLLLDFSVANSQNMFYQDALHKFLVLSLVDSLGKIGGRTGESWPLVFSEKPNQQIYFHLCLSMWGAHFCMGAYKHNRVVVSKWVINGCLFSMGA